MLSFLKCVCFIVCKVLFFVKPVNIENVPKEGAVILAANHTSLWDPIVLIPLFKRKMRVMAKKELMKNPFLRKILEIAYAIPVDRGKSDITAIKTALKTLKDGEVFGIFPSGTRVKDGEDADAKTGVALISSRSGAPVVPVAIRGGYKPFCRVTVYFGEPIIPEEKKLSADELKDYADMIMEKIEEWGK